MALQTGIFDELLSAQRDELVRQSLESRSSLENPQTPLSYPAEWLLDIFNGGRTDSGIRVSQITAFQVSAFCACVDFIAGLVASFPKHVFERTVVKNGRASHRIAYEHDLYDIISLEPNEEMSRFTFDKAYMVHVLGWGNAYAELQRDGGNQILAMWPRNPYKTRPHRLSADLRLEAAPWRPFPVLLRAGELVYRTTDGVDEMDRSDLDSENGAARIIPKEDMLHLPGLTFDGRIGQDVVWLARQVLGLALATEKFGAKYFANFAKPGGILELPQQKPEDREQSKRSWLEAQGGENAHRIAVMPTGAKFTPLSNKPDESQMTETEEKQGIKITSLFHLPPRVIGLGRVTSRSNSEQEGQEIMTYALAPWLAGLKAEYKRKCFPHPGVGSRPKNRFFVDFDTTQLERASSADREAFYASGRQWAYLNSNDVRAFEKLNPIEEDWAEKYWMPVNMTLTETPIDPTHQDGSGKGDAGDADTEPGGDDQDPVSARYATHYSRLFRDAFGRTVTREKRDFKVIAAVFGPVLYSMRDGLFDLASQQMRVKGAPGVESDRFVAEYMNALAIRAADWTAAQAEATVPAELRRAVRAISVAAYREAASLKAKAAAPVGEGEDDDD